jgi:hypothetical protein
MALFFGTSNFVIQDGIVKYFRLASGRDVLNRSIGGCTSALGTYLFRDVPRGNGRDSFIFLDYQINDSQAVNKSLCSPEQLVQNLRDVIFVARSAGYIPVLLILPSVGTYRNANAMEMAQVALAKELSVFYWNCAEDIRSLLAEDIPENILMRDTAHMSVDACALFGKALARCTDAITLAEGKDVSIETDVRSFRRVSADTVANGHETFTRSSSLATTTLLRLNEGETIRLAADSSQELAGLLINTGAAGAIVRFTNGTEERSKKLVMYWNAASADKYSVIFVDCFQALPGGSNGITIEVMAQDHAVTEPMLHGREPLPNRYGVVEIEGFLLRDRQARREEQMIRCYPDLPLDLSTFGDHPDFRNQVRQLVSGA